MLLAIAWAGDIAIPLAFIVAAVVSVVLVVHDRRNGFK